MAEELKRPTDILGTLPIVAAHALAKQEAHDISIMRMGALTVDTLDLNELKGFTIEQKQVADSCAGLVIFFARFELIENGKYQKYVDEPETVRAIAYKEANFLALAFANGVLGNLERTVLYLGEYNDPTKTGVRWLSLPLDSKKWLNFR